MQICGLGASVPMCLKGFVHEVPQMQSEVSSFSLLMNEGSDTSRPNAITSTRSVTISTEKSQSAGLFTSLDFSSHPSASDWKVAAAVNLYSVVNC